MDEKELEKLFKAMSAKYNVGDYNTFKGKMATTDSRKRFYDVVSQKGIDLGDYNMFETRLAGSKPTATQIATPTQPSKKEDLSKAFQALREMAPEDKGGNVVQQQTQAIRNTKPLVAAVPKKKMSSKEVEAEAERRVSDPINNVIYRNNDDPIGTVAKIGQRANAEIFNNPDNWMDEDALNEAEINDKVTELAQKYTFPTSRQAFLFLREQLKKQTGQEVDIMNMPVEQLEGALPKTLTAQSALEKIKARKIIDEAYAGNLEEMSLRLSGLAHDAPEVQRGRALSELLNSPEIIDKAETDPVFGNDYRQTKANLYSHYPSLAKQEIAQKISQYREDKGMNSPWYNDPSAKRGDEIVEQMVKEGVLDSDGALVYKTQIRPLMSQDRPMQLGGFEENPIATTGFLETFSKTARHGFDGMGKSIRNTGSLIDDLVGSPLKNLGLAEDSKTRANRILQENYSAVAVEPKSLATTISNATGNVGGFMLPMVLGGAIAKGVGLPAKLAEAAPTYLMFAGENYDRGLSMFPDDATKRALFTGVSTLGDMYLMKLLPLGKAADGVKKNFRKEIAQTVAQFTDRKITEAAAKQSILSTFKNVLAKGGELVKENARVGGVMGMFTGFHSGVEALFGGDVTFADAANEALQSAKMGFLGSTPLSVMAMRGGAASKLNGATVREAAENPEHFIKLTDSPDIQRNITEASKIWNEIKDLDYSEAQKEKFLLKALSENVLSRKAEETTNPVIKKTYEEGAKEAAKVQKEIIEGKDKAEDHESFISKEERESLKPVVIKPEEVKKPEVTTIEPMEVQPSEKTKGAKVILPQTNKPAEVVELKSTQSGIEEVKESEVIPEQVLTDKESFREQVLTDLSNEKSSEYDWVFDELPLQQDRRKAGVKDLRAGKNTKAAQAVQQSIDKMFNEGYVYLNRGRGDNVERIAIPIKEYIEEVKKPLEATEKDLTELNTILGDDAFNDHFDRAFNEVVKTNENAKRTTKVAATTKPATATAKASSSKVAAGKSKASPDRKAPPKSEPAAEPTKPVKASDKLRSFADKIEKEGVLPSFLKADIGDAKKSGFGGKELDKAVAEAVRKVADAIDAAKDISEAIKEGFEHLREYYKANTKSFNEERVRDDFEKFIKENYREEIKPGKEVGIKHEATEELREQYSLGEYERNNKTDKELEAEADAIIAKGDYNYEGLIRKLERGDQPSGVENMILKRMMADMDARLQKDPSKKNLDDLNRLVKALDKIGSLQSEAFRTRKGMRFSEETLPGMLTLERELNFDTPLTEGQVKTVEKEHKQISETQKAYKEKYDELKAKAEIDEIKKTIGKKSKKQHSDYVKDREAIKNAIKEKLRKARGEMNVTPVPYAKELFAIAPDVAKLMKSYLEEGVDKLSDLVKNIHNDIKDGIPESTEKDVLDIIAGKYADQRPTRNELAAKLYDLKLQAKLQIQLDAKLRGEKTIKGETAKAKHSAEVEELKKKIKEFDDANKPEESNADLLNKAKENTKRQIEKIEKQLKSGDFSQPPKPVKVELDAEGIELKSKLLEVKKERAIRIAKLKMESRTDAEKRMDAVANVLNIPRTIMASADYSAPLRQAVIPTIAHPYLAWKAGKEMFKQGWSQKRFDEFFIDLRESPEFKLMEDSGLYIADPHNLHLTVKEEAFMTNIPEKIPGLGRVIKGSERAYVSFLNKMRVDLFRKGVESFVSDGRTFENSPELYKAWAKYVNLTTGRGDLGKLEGFAPVLNSLFFSPRLIASRLNLLNPFYYKSLPKGMRLMVAKDMGLFIGFGLAMIGMAKLNGADVEDNPTSSDFGKIRMGDTRYDIWGGFQQYVTFLSRMALQERKSQGRTKDLQDKDLIGLPTQFMRNKLAPVPALLTDVYFGSDAVGEPVTFKNELYTNITPLLWQDLIEAYGKQGAVSLLTNTLPATFGVGVQSYTPKVRVSKKETKPKKPKKPTKNSSKD